MLKISKEPVLPVRFARFTGILTAFSVLAACLSLTGFAAGPTANIAHASPMAGVWTQQLSGANSEVRQFSRTDANHLWAAGSYGRVMRTTDGGQNWSISLMPDPVMLMQSVHFVDNQVGWAAGEWHSQGVLFRSTDGGITWQEQNEPTGQRLFGVWALNRQVVMVVGGGTYQAITRRSTDGGQTWSDMPVPLNDSMFLDISFVDSNNGWVTGLDGGIARTTDGGITWQAQHPPQTYGLESINFSDPNNGWAGGYYGALLHTTNGGDAWIVQNPVLPDYTHVLGVSAVSSTVAWITGYGGGAQSEPFVKKSTDGGNTWVDYTPAVGPYDGFAAVLFLDEEYGWAGGHAGIFRRTPEGPLPSPTSTATQAATLTRTPTRTAVGTATATAIATASSTNTAIATPSNTVTPQRTRVRTATATRTPTPRNTETVIPTATKTNTPRATMTAGRTGTPRPSTPTAQPTTRSRFSDVDVSDYFYTSVNWLSGQGILSGYSDGTFRPFNDTTRGQLSKIVTLAEGWSIDTTGGPHFIDVPATNPFYGYIETAYNRGVISGYSDGTFLPGNNVTRGQLSKIVVSARGWAMDTTGGPHFSDVPTDSSFYMYVETAYNRGVISGYTGGTFLPGNNASRGQISKIVYNALNDQR